MELSIVIGAAAVVAFLYTLAERYLDLTEPAGAHAVERHAADAPAPAASGAAPIPGPAAPVGIV